MMRRAPWHHYCSFVLDQLNAPASRRPDSTRRGTSTARSGILLRLLSLVCCPSPSSSAMRARGRTAAVKVALPESVFVGIPGTRRCGESNSNSTHPRSPNVLLASSSLRRLPCTRPAPGWHPHPQHRQDLGEARPGRPHHRGHREPPGTARRRKAYKGLRIPACCGLGRVYGRRTS